MELTGEEKKAIEWFKEDLTKEKEEMEYYNEYKKQVIKRNEKLLNLIEKQQKEIEELKQNRDEYKEEYKKLLNARYYDYISKDKIREKMREIMGYTISSSEERHCQNYAYDRLKELLEENKV